MPNWCENTLVIRGKPEALRALSDRLAADADRHENLHLTFQSFAPHDETVAPGSDGSANMGRRKDTGKWEHVRYIENPDRRESSDEPRYIPDPAHEAELLDVGRHPYVTLGDGTILTEDEAREAGIRSWYDWNVANWGTKWDACHVQVIEDDLDDGTLVYRFDTAWSPPVPVVEAMIEALPDFRVRLHATEPGMGFQVFVYPDGLVKEMDYVDVAYFLEDDDDDLESLNLEVDEAGLTVEKEVTP